MKSEILKIAGVKNQREFYKLFPTEEDFMKVHGKEFKKSLRKNSVKQAQQGATTDYNQQNVGANPQADVTGELNKAMSNFTTPVEKKTTGQTIANATKSIPIVGKLIGGITGLFDAAAERKRQVRAGQLSDLQLKASQSAPRRENRKYNRPDLDGAVDDINSLMPAEGTGTNLLGRDGITVSRGGGEIANTYSPNTLYRDLGYEPLSESERIKAYYYGGHVPQASLGSLVGGILGGSGGSGGGIGGLIGGLLGGNKKEEPTQVAGQVITGANDNLQKIGQSASPSGVGNNAINKEIMRNNVAQGAQATATGLSAIPGMNTKTAQSSKAIGEAVGSAIPVVGAIASPILGAVAQGIGAIAENKSGKKAMDRIKRNNDQMAAAQTSKVMQSQNAGFMEQGGWISHDWQPQVITHFGEHSIHDLLRKDPTMGTLREGGHIRQNYSPEMERTGELSTLWGGHAEPLSYNPHLPEGGETVMFKGRSHDESDGRGRTGIGVRYGEGGDLQPYGANVEVERGEPAVQLPDETGENNLVVYGNLPIPNQFVDMLGDPKAKGKKFKSYVADLSERENKYNKSMSKAVSELNDLDPTNPYEKLKFDTLSIIIRGNNEKLKDVADKKEKAAHLQQAINDTAEERGIDAEHLAKGKIKAAKGANIHKAQDGTTERKKRDTEMSKTAFAELDGVEETNSRDELDKRIELERKYARENEGLYGGSRGGFDSDASSAYAYNRKRINELKMRLKLPDNYEYSPPTTPSYNTDDLRRAKTPEEKIRIQNAMLEQRDNPSSASTKRLPKYDNIARGEGKLDWSTPDQAGGIWKGERYQKEWVPAVDSHFSDRDWAEQMVHDLENYEGQDYADVRAILAKESTMEGKIKRAQELAKDGKVGPYHNLIREHLNDTYPRMKPLPPDLKQDIPPREIKPLEKPPTQEEPPTVPQFFNPLPPYLPSNQEDLDPRQLTGEYYALATNQLEPVPAQQYHPTLRTPYEVSLQDILNENTAATRGAQRMVGYNPAAQSNLLSQQYAANQKVLGEQFRINQEFKDKIYDRNVDILNDAQLKNLGILDRQYERQAQALSKTKDVAREALSSISDKYLQNQLSNRTLATYENMYNYRYDKNQHAWNMNAPAQWNMTGNNTNPSGWEDLTDAQKKAAVEEAEAREARKKASESTKKGGRNGAILKAFRDL